MERRLIENDLLFSSIPSPSANATYWHMKQEHSLEHYFYCFLCLQLLKVFHVLHSGPTIPFEDGELPQDTCRARGKADIRYSMDYHFEIRYSKDYHFENVLQVNLETFVVPVGDPDMKLEWFLR